jgi:parallel beta-helix repeat protein
MLASFPSTAADRHVGDSRQLLSAIEQAAPGTRIILSAGEYLIDRVQTRAGGTLENPIALRPATPGTAIIKAQGGFETFSVRHPHWIFEGLIIQGNSGSVHAFHLSDDADHVIIRRNVITNFHAPIKANGRPDKNDSFPDQVLIEDNTLYNTAARATEAPVTFVDVVGGKGWIVRGNYIADFAKGGGDHVSYGVFLKGNSTDGLIKHNWVVCSQAVISGGARVGLSLGGGGTEAIYYENKDSRQEHSRGVIRNNIVLNCSDAGIYLNKARASLVEDNLLLLTKGIDIRFPPSTALVRGNLMTGSIRERDGGRAETQGNLVFGIQARGLAAAIESLKRRMLH